VELASLHRLANFLFDEFFRKHLNAPTNQHSIFRKINQAKQHLSTGTAPRERLRGGLIGRPLAYARGTLYRSCVARFRISFYQANGHEKISTRLLSRALPLRALRSRRSAIAFTRRNLAIRSRPRRQIDDQ